MNICVFVCGVCTYKDIHACMCVHVCIHVYLTIPSAGKKAEPSELSRCW